MLKPKDEETTTLIDIFEELGTWTDLPCDIKMKIRENNINVENSDTLKFLVKKWKRGHYDDDPDQLHEELLSLIN
jgi:hypothetical protein